MPRGRIRRATLQCVAGLLRLGWVVLLVAACGGSTRSNHDGTQSGGSGGGPGASGGDTSTSTGGLAVGGAAGSPAPGSGATGGVAIGGCGSGDLASDAENCGVCGRQCCPGSMCFNGQCAVGCPPGLIQCGSSSVEPECTARCVDLLSDSSHCGQCDFPCPPGVACVNGVCASPITEDDLGSCTASSDCIVVAYSHCCGATKRAINGAYLEAYQSHPEWQVFDDPAICALIGLCPDDSAVTQATCADGLCSLVYP